MRVEHTVQLLLLRHKEQIMVSIIAWTTTVFLQWKHVLFRPGEHIAKRYRPSSWTKRFKAIRKFRRKTLSAFIYALVYIFSRRKTGFVIKIYPRRWPEISVNLNQKRHLIMDINQSKNSQIVLYVRSGMFWYWA